MVIQCQDLSKVTQTMSDLWHSHPDGKYIVCLAQQIDETVRIWDVETSKTVLGHSQQSDSLYQICCILTQWKICCFRLR